VIKGRNDYSRQVVITHQGVKMDRDMATIFVMQDPHVFEIVEETAVPTEGLSIEAEEILPMGDVSPVAAAQNPGVTSHPQATTGQVTVADASHFAVKLADENGIDLSQVKGTGENGRILKSDVEALIK
jgi:pyruvate/2-oxoglutarate dehydrogenase complex dihydrolipoamide acyltransferase (E2) component